MLQSLSYCYDIIHDKHKFEEERSVWPLCFRGTSVHFNGKALAVFSLTEGCDRAIPTVVNQEVRACSETRGGHKCQPISTSQVACL